MSAKKETYSERINRKVLKKQHIVDVAMGRKKADLVLKNATYINVFTNELCKGDIAVAKGQIAGMGNYSGDVEIDVSDKIVCPGFIDAHIHLESSLASPKEFAKAVIPHGTTSVITDPHEITNVMGTNGIEYMLQATQGLPIDIRFMLPSCVPATPLDESGANLDYRTIDAFYDHPRVQGLAEMMNYVGVVGGDKQVLEKIVAAQAHHKKIDGHAPDITNNTLSAYIAVGVYSDHECHDIEDAKNKIRNGQYIMLRDGTAAKNLDALVDLLKQPYYDRCMFCTDDKHPIDLLLKGHIDYIIKKAINLGVDPIVAVKVASHNAAKYFALNNRGAIAPGYLADFAVIDNFDDFNVEMVFKKGQLSAQNGVAQPFETPVIDKTLNDYAHDTFHLSKLKAEDFDDNRPRGIIGIVENEIVTTDEGYATQPDTDNDILRIAVAERHKNTGHIGLGYIKGYGLKSGAIATSISHDSHNIIVVGTNQQDMATAVNRIVENHGGITIINNNEIVGEVVLEIAGLMTDDSLSAINDKLEDAKAQAFKLGVNKNIDPFMTLSFMSLPVIPSLRLTTRGVFDVTKQQYV